MHYYCVLYLIVPEETLGGVDSKCSDGWDENSVGSISLTGDNILDMDMEEEAVKINRVEQQHNKNLENKASNMVMAKTKFPAKTRLDGKRKCDGNSLAVSSKKAKNPEQLMTILAKGNKPIKLAGSPSRGKLPVRIKNFHFLNNFQTTIAWSCLHLLSYIVLQEHVADKSMNHIIFKSDAAVEFYCCVYAKFYQCSCDYALCVPCYGKIMGNEKRGSKLANKLDPYLWMEEEFEHVIKCSKKHQPDLRYHNVHNLKLCKDAYMLKSSYRASLSRKGNICFPTVCHECKKRFEISSRNKSK